MSVLLLTSRYRPIAWLRFIFFLVFNANKTPILISVFKYLLLSYCSPPPPLAACHSGVCLLSCLKLVYVVLIQIFCQFWPDALTQHYSFIGVIQQVLKPWGHRVCLSHGTILMFFLFVFFYQKYSLHCNLNFLSKVASPFLFLSATAYSWHYAKKKKKLYKAHIARWNTSCIVVENK